MRTELKIARLRNGLTQRQLAEQIGVGFKEVSHWEVGDRTPTVQTIKKLGTILGIENILDLF